MRGGLGLLLLFASAGWTAEGPFAWQVVEQVERLASDDARARAGAAEALGFLRACEAEDELIVRLKDGSVEVRREAAMALGWCGGRESVEPLIAAMDDTDWTVAQGAWVALTNITGMEFPFDALGERDARAWREWWARAKDEAIPAEVRELLRGGVNLAAGSEVTGSTTYRGPPNVLTDGKLGPEYWQTKNVEFPQSCAVDLGEVKTIARVLIQQYADGYVMTDYEVATSGDGETWRSLGRKEQRSPAQLVVEFEPREARHVRITSYDNANRTYPTTFREIEISPPSNREQERGLRALGALGGEGAAELVMATLGPMRARPDALTPTQQAALKAGMAALGRLKDDGALPWMIGWLWETEWARSAAQALGEMGDDRAVPVLLAAYPTYAKGTNGERPARAPRDDTPGFLDLDRMYETPFHIAEALARLPWDDPRNRASLRQLAPLLIANLPQDFDGMMLYEPEAAQRITAYLLEVAGARREAVEAGLGYLEGDESRDGWPTQNARQVATWLPALGCESGDVERLVGLLEHENGWVRINACKTLAFLGDGGAVGPLVEALTAARNEAAYGYSGRFLDEEYADAAPRVREALVRALGILGARETAGLVDDVCADEGSVLEVRLAAARALADLGAADELREIAEGHALHTVRNAAREALWRRGQAWERRQARRLSYEGDVERPQAGMPAPREGADAAPGGYVFIKGDNVLPNFFQNDHWRQAYVTTDTGPSYRPGRNLWVLNESGEARPLTEFPDGYVAECEVSWDGTRIIFTRRGEDDPWWHVCEINADGTGFRQITDGPYHDVGPAYLPDGRIVFASSRGGMRDEYHGYLCTALHVMNPDGTDIHPIAINAGRDNEPAVMADGRIVFARLEVFYSRLKTELTIHAAYPDGTRDVVLYGPERREFWRALDVGPRGDDYAAQTPAMHRVLRISQPQSMADGGIVCASQGGLVVVGRERGSERIVPHDENMAFTTPYPLPDGRMLCASTLKAKAREDVDLGIYVVEPQTGEMELVYNDPEAADYEARPLVARPLPPTLAEATRSGEFTGTFTCISARDSQEPGVEARGRLVRVIEGQPRPARHSTQTNPGEVWQNHGGTLARVLGTVPLADDGSFSVEVPADRLLHFQILDSDRKVVANQLTWIYVRPGETRTCVGCHEQPDTTPMTQRPMAAGRPPVKCLPFGDEFNYRAKVWLKGNLPPQADERTRTARAVNLHAR